MPYTIDVDDHGLAEKLALLGRRELRASQRRGVTNAVKFGRTTARGFAPVGVGADAGKGRRGVSYRVRSRGTAVVGKVYNKVFYMRFLARGTGDRYTKGRKSVAAGAYRGRASDPFMERASTPTDAAAPKFIADSVGDALRAAGLL